MVMEKRQQPTGGLAIWRGDEYMLNFLFTIRLQFQQTNKDQM
jgi:hypothetical protein